MPHSIFSGRPMPAPGEPLFTEEDTAVAVALAEEERDACPTCGMPKAWCRDIANQFAFEVHEETCHATYTVAAHRVKADEKRTPETRAATMVSSRFRAGHAPDLEAGLNLSSDSAKEQS